MIRLKWSMSSIRIASPIPWAAEPVGEPPDLVEEVRAVVQAGQRVADGPLEHLALEVLVGGVEPDELEQDVAAELDAVALLDVDRLAGVEAARR